MKNLLFMKNLFTRTCALFLSSCLVLCQTGCSTDESLDEHGTDSGSQVSHFSNQTSGAGETLHTVDLMAGFTAGRSEEENFSVSSDFLKSCMDFSLRLFQQSNLHKESGRNLMISPYSALTALSMAINGANGDTRKEMLDVLCQNSKCAMTAEELNRNMKAVISGLPSHKDARLLQANSIWFRESESVFQVNPDFLQCNADYYQADAFKAPFDDQTTADINKWVSDHTDNMIPSILKQIPDNVVMYLINALTFDAAWASPYTEDQILENEFTNEDGSISRVSMMHSQENQYLQTAHGTGFLKPYKEGYSFAALLPEEGMSLDDFIADMTSEDLYETLTSPVSEPVQVSLPGFTSEYDTDLSETLISMGMKLPFNEDHADFGSLGTCRDGNLFISRILHKTYISVDGNGTRAGAATAVEMRLECCISMNHEVELNRPFIYMIIDQATCTPIFMGTVTKLPNRQQ